MSIVCQISEAMQKGRAKLVKELISAALEEGVSPKAILEDGLLAGMNIVGAKFKKNEVFVPEVLIAARAMNAGTAMLKPYLTASGAEPLGKACLGTVKGDLHDIGKNLVRMMLEGKGIEVIDLGVDVPVEKFISAAEENPDVKIELVEHLTEEHNKQLKLWAQSGELPDIFWCQEGDVLEYGENGYLLPLNDFLSQNPDIDSAIPDAIKNCYAGENGEIYGLAYTSLVTGFYYNKAIFADNGLPELTNETTYEELLDMVKTLHDNGVTTFAQGAMTNYSVWGYLGSLNRYGYAENIAAIADGSQSSAVFSKLFDKLAELGAAGAYPQNMATIDYFEAKNLFTTGQAAIFTSGQWDAGEIGEALGENVGFWWGPTYTDSDYSQKTSNQFANCPFVVSADVAKDEAKQAAVYRFLAFYFGKEGSSILFDNSNIPIATYADLQMENTNPAFAAISEALATGYASTTASNPVASLTASVSETFYDAMNSLMLGNITTEQAVASIDTAFAEAAQ